MENLAPSNKQTTFTQWLEEVSRTRKTSYVFELEMWIKCFDRFFRPRNQPIQLGEENVFLIKDFREELAIVRDVTLRMSYLANEIMSKERSRLLQFDRYIHNTLRRDYVMDEFLNRLLEQPTPDDSLALLLDSLADLRTLIDDMVRLPEVTFQTFTAIGKLINREIKQCRYIDMLVAYKFKVQYDRVDNPAIAALIKRVPDETLRQDLAKIFLELFRLLRYLDFIEKDLENDRPLKNSLLVFSLINSEVRILFDFIEVRICKNPNISPRILETLDSAVFALSQEMKKVFSHELVGLVYLRQAPPIYAKVENSHGMLRNALQQTIVHISNAFDSEFDAKSLFTSYTTRLEESRKLLNEIGSLVDVISEVEPVAELEKLLPLAKVFDEFRESTLKLLMYKDWEEYENFVEEVTGSKSVEGLKFALHRFRIYLEALTGEVRKRSVLQTAATV
ncbi:MAG TPA: hypothetical protein VMW38_20180 [Terriglobia bacterium]|nr:hypothetical protein [Terriglobia bacterium]